MEEPSDESGFRFLFRQDHGRIDPLTWWRGSAGLGGVLAVLTAIWLYLSPSAHRDLGTTPFLAWWTLAAYVYLLVYAFAVLLIAICHTNLSAKRWRDRGRPPSLAGLLPLAALVTGAAHWLQPRVAETISYWYVLGTDLLLAGIIVWTIVELGFDRPRIASGPR
jgi:uncharacterized membrane protein YhaH (DUF805 family)